MGSVPAAAAAATLFVESCRKRRREIIIELLASDAPSDCWICRPERP
jgi:hypothetical protein